MKLIELISWGGFEVNLQINGSTYYEEYLDYDTAANDDCITFWNTADDGYDLICVIRNEDIIPSNSSFLDVEGLLPGSDNDEECMGELLSTGKLVADDTGEDITEELSHYYKAATIKLFFTKSLPASIEEIAAEFLIGKL